MKGEKAPSTRSDASKKAVVTKTVAKPSAKSAPKERHSDLPQTKVQPQTCLPSSKTDDGVVLS